MTLTTDPSKRLVLDQMGRRILRRLAAHLHVDIGAVADEVGAVPDVVRDRIAAMRQAGLLQGFEVRLDATRLERTFEYLVSGAPGAGTDGKAIAHLCGAAGVTRVFSLASLHGVAFTVAGKDAADTQRLGLALAEQAGLRHAQAVLILNTFQDRAGTPAAALPGEPQTSPLVSVSEGVAAGEALAEPVAA